MIKNYQLNLFSFIFITALFLFSFWIQSNIFMNWDVGWHLLGAERMLHGAGYLNGVFDDNPPMVFWLFMPIIWVSRYFSISMVTTQIIFVQFITLLGFALSYIFLNQLYVEENRWKLYTMRYAVFALLLFFPTFEFGSREMLLVALSLPYVVLAGVRTRFSHPDLFRPILLVLAGLFLSIGIALNPQYSVVVLALELYLWINEKKIMLWRTETITFAIMFPAYLLAVYVVYPSYYTVIIPAFFAFSPGFNADWKSLVFYNASSIFFQIRSDNQFHLESN